MPSRFGAQIILRLLSRKWEEWCRAKSAEKAEKREQAEKKEKAEKEEQKTKEEEKA